MTKSLRRIAALGILLLGAAVTISAGGPAQKLFNAEQESFIATPDSNVEHTAKVEFVATPGKVICKGDIAEFTVRYSQKDEYILAPITLAPLEPMPTGEMGTLTASASPGSVPNPTRKVGMGPGYVRFQYIPEDTVAVTMEVILSYPGLNLTVNDATSFTVKECTTYKVTIKGWVSITEGDETVTSWTDAEGDISVTDTEAFGTLNMIGGYDITPVNQLVTCSSHKSEGYGKAKVDGKFYFEPKDPSIRYLQLNFHYENLMGFEGREVVCKDKITGEIKQTYSLPALKSVDPHEFLQPFITFLNPKKVNTDRFPYGSSPGWVYYIVERVD